MHSLRIEILQQIHDRQIIFPQFCHMRTFLQHKKAFVSICVLSLLCLSTFGCKDGRPKRVAVSGKVLIDGKPLTMGNVAFYSTTTKGRPSNGPIQPDGSFSLFTFEVNDGIPPGEYAVSVSSKEGLSKSLSEDISRHNIPPKYEDIKTSGIVKKIEGPMNDMAIELTWKGSGKTGPYIVDGNKQ
jgi:hypothetical protein